MGISPMNDNFMATNWKTKGNGQMPGKIQSTKIRVKKF